MTRINCEIPRSMYLFYIRVKRVLSKNHGGVPPKGLWNELLELEMDAKNYYFCDAYFERKSNKPMLPEPPKSEIFYETFTQQNIV